MLGESWLARWSGTLIRNLVFNWMFSHPSDTTFPLGVGVRSLNAIQISPRWKRHAMTGVDNLRTSVKGILKLGHIMSEYCANTNGVAFLWGLDRTAIERGLMQCLQPDCAQECFHWLYFPLIQQCQENQRQRAVSRNACTLILDLSPYLGL